MPSDPKAAAVELILLSVLADGPQYGYAATKQVAARSNGEIRLTPGVLYPLLRDLEKDGLIAASWEEVRSGRNTDDEAQGRKRKWYTLTPKGKRHLAKRIAAHRTWTAIIDSFIDPSASRSEEQR
jgi:PadR family transcriptional regulator, regulatory protein PadR